MQNLLLMRQKCTFQLLLFIEQQNKGFQRSIYWNEYKTKEINENADANVFKYINLGPSFQGVNRLFVTAYNRVDGQPNRDDQ